MKLRWTWRSRADLLKICDFISLEKPQAAKAWATKLRRRALQAADLHSARRIVPEFGRDDILEILEDGYRVVYRVLEDERYILTVFEGHRDFG